MVVCNSELEEQRRAVEVDRAHMRGEEVPAYLLKKDLNSDVDGDVRGEALKSCCPSCGLSPQPTS